jgi:hypothetical protein
MDKVAIRDAMPRQAIQFAYFINGDGETAVRFATAAMSEF